MGLEIIVLLVDVSRLKLTLDLAWNMLYEGLEKRTLRNTRPVQDSRLKILFDIDAEAELLDWMDAQPWAKDEDKSFLQLLDESTDGEKGLLLAMKWASPGAWEVWEGRAYLYLDVALNTIIDGEDILYGGKTWDNVRNELAGLPESEYAEKVCMDWMERRKALGETLDETEDARIVPTYEAHDRAAKSLVYTMNRWNSESDIAAIIGRDHLEARKWGTGQWNISKVLVHGLPDDTTASG
ncbi:MAG: hypothetical protein ISR25_04490 [Candidatus Poseidoniaceae archaeon]|nr:hypothetical protein [Candidatus Poseidoniaceae archaeon]MBL6889730.1 hypothetical protein [Candidatus Poseidoniaceae archaeon]